MTRQEVSAWENGKRTPTLKNLRKIARALNVTIDEIKNYNEGSADARLSQKENECWKDLAFTYKSRIAELEEEVKSLKSELKRQIQNKK